MPTGAAQNERSGTDFDRTLWTFLGRGFLLIRPLLFDPCAFSKLLIGLWGNFDGRQRQEQQQWGIRSI